MRSAFRSALLGLSAVALMTAAPLLAEARPLTATDMQSLDRLSDPRLSPDGGWVVYQVRVADLEANRGRNSLWIMPAAGGEGRQLPATAEGASTPRWVGSHIYFLSSRSGSSQVWRTDADGAAAVQVTRLPLDVGAFAVTPDEGRIVVSLAVFPDCETIACTVERHAAVEADKSSGQIYDQLFIRHWDTWADGTRNHLYAAPLDAEGAAGEAARLTPGFDGDTPSKPFGGDEEWTFTPDARSMIFAARIAGRTEPSSTNFDLFRVPLDASAAPENLTGSNPAWDTGAVFSPDGRQMAYRAMKRPGYEADRFAIMLRDVATGETRELAADWDRSADDIKWSPDGRTLYALAGDVGQTRIFGVDVASGRVTALTGAGNVAAFQVAGASLIYARDSMAGPAQLWRAETRRRVAPVQLTRANTERLAGVDLSDYEQFSFAGWNNETVHGYVMKPHGYVEGRRYPVAFLIHGGPQSSFGDSWSYRWNPQAWAGAGYAVVVIDFHGSTGYGQGFTDAIREHWGDRPLEDLQKGWAAALERYGYLDGDRACALGGSYGGYMVTWMAGVWNQPWRCFVAHDAIFDARAMNFTTEELWFDDWEHGGPYTANPEVFERFNALNHVTSWTRPILVVHGGQDFRVPLEQGISVFTAAQRRGIESRFLYFPDENHWVLKPQNSIQWYDTVLGWMNQHTAAR